MRITGGDLRGRTIVTSGFQGIRPTTDRARETIFNILANHCDVEDASVLDLCAGSGALGIESLSRGAASGVFIEKSRSNARLLEQTLAQLGLQDAARVLALDVLKGIPLLAAEKKTFSLIFCDPPYAAKLINPVFLTLIASNCMTEGGIFVAEHDTREIVLVPKGWQKLTDRSFGETVVEFFINKSSSDASATISLVEG